MNWTCWGSNAYGEGDTPAFFKERKVRIVTAAIGRHFLCLVVKKIGTQQTLHCWGDDEHGQIQIPSFADEFVNEVNAGDYHTCAIYNEGTPVCFGLNSYGQLDIPHYANKINNVSARNLSTCYLFERLIECIGQLEYQRIIPNEYLNNSLHFQMGHNHYCSVIGNFECYGDNKFGQSTLPLSLKVPGHLTTPMTNFHSYSNHTCASFVDIIICWGQNTNGQVDQANYSEKYSYTEAVAGHQHTCARKYFYTISCWGSNKYNATKVNPVVEEFVFNFTAAGDFTCVVKYAKVKCYGKHDRKLNKVPEEIQSRVELIKSGFSHTCGVYNNSTKVVCWGLKEKELFESPVDFKSTNSHFIYLMSTGYKYTCLTYQKINQGPNSLICFGLNSKGTLDSPSFPSPENYDFSDPDSLLPISFLKLDSGMEHSCVISGVEEQERLQCWGSNERGQLDIPAGFIEGILNLTVGYYHSCACRYTACQCWGYNKSGQTDIPALVVRRPGMNIYAGGSHSCVVDTEWNMACWGSNKFSQLKLVKTYQGTYTNVQLGMNHTCVSNFNGKVRCFGDDAEGQVTHMLKDE